MDRQFWIDDEHQGEAADPRDRYEILHRVVVDILMQIRIGGKRRIGCHQQRIAVGGLVMNVKRSERAVCAGTVLDDHRLA
jgi:hypothetical protein